jgi:hypothetical protein
MTAQLDGFIASLALALKTLPTDAGRRNFLGHAYKELVGYDPFEDDPSQTVDEITALYCGVAFEHAQPVDEGTHTLALVIKGFDDDQSGGVGVQSKGEEGSSPARICMKCGTIGSLADFPILDSLREPD